MTTNHDLAVALYEQEYLGNEGTWPNASPQDREHFTRYAERVLVALRADHPTPPATITGRDVYLYEAGVEEGIRRASTKPAEPVECAICGDYTAGGVEVHELCLEPCRYQCGKPKGHDGGIHDPVPEP